MAEFLTELMDYLDTHGDIFQMAIAIVIAMVIFTIISRFIKRQLLKKTKSKKQRSNVILFIDMLRFIFLGFLLLVGLIAYYGRWGDLGFFAGLLTVTIGWALQKPLTGVIAWLILVSQKHFNIGDRVIVSGIKGDVTNITLTHIFLDEVGGTIDGEEHSGRTVMIPTSIIFEEEMINYTDKDDYILDEVVTTITYESDLEKAEEIMISSVEKILKPLREKSHRTLPTGVHNRLKFKASGIDVTVRYYTLATRRNETSTNIVREIFKAIRESNKVEIAYPHTQIVLKNKILEEKLS